MYTLVFWKMAENMTYDVGFISVNYPGVILPTLKKHYCLNIYGLNILYSDGQDDGPAYSEVAYGVDAGPGLLVSLMENMRGMVQRL